MRAIDYIFYFFFYSFVGWFFESCYCSFKPKKWINRGFLYGPLCPIYGTGAIVVMVLLLPLRSVTDNLYINELIIFVLGMVVCDIVEFMTSLIMEKLFHARWWDYSGMRFNIQGRICLTHTFYWGTASCLFAFVGHPLIENYLVGLISSGTREKLTYIFLGIFAVDLVLTVLNALSIRKISLMFQEKSEEISDFAKIIYGEAGAKIGDKKSDLMDKYNELHTSYEDFKESVKAQATKGKRRLMNISPYLKEGFTKEDILLEDLLADIKEKIQKLYK